MAQEGIPCLYHLGRPTYAVVCAHRHHAAAVAGHKAVYECIKVFSETDMTEDLKKFDVPTLILHGDDDQIVPIADSAMLSSKLIKGAVLHVIPGAPHGMCSTLKDQMNAELLAFLQARRS